jgi:mannan endo-1,4-beta-mannosidase
MDAYVRWRTYQDPSFVPYHDSFYTDETIKGWFKTWAATLINRVNAITGVAYKDDPTIFAWQLANEPRCGTSGGYNMSDNCVSSPGTNPTSAVVAWADEMSTYIKSIDPNHMISMGDEGFYCNATSNAPGSSCTPGAWWCDCSSGVDSLGLMSLPHIDYGTAHLYPENWGQTAQAQEWGTQWILNHTQQAHALAVPKPFVVEELGIDDVTRQRGIYAAWTAAAVAGNTNGWHYWMLAGLTDPKGWYPGDALNIYCTKAGDPALPPGHDGQTCGVLSAAAIAMQGA